jgi:hypothetical protein
VRFDAPGEGRKRGGKGRHARLSASQLLLPAVGSDVTASVTFAGRSGGSATAFKVEAPHASGAAIEGVVDSLSADTLVLRAGSVRVTLRVPASLDLSAFGRGQRILAYFSEASDGSLVLVGAARDGSVAEADDDTVSVGTVGDEAATVSGDEAEADDGVFVCGDATTSGDPTSGDAASGDPASGDAASGDPVVDDGTWGPIETFAPRRNATAAHASGCDDSTGGTVADGSDDPSATDDGSAGDTGAGDVTVEVVALPPVTG